MIKIKKYKEINESDNSFFYEEITANKFEDLLGDGRIYCFTDSEISKITSAVKSYPNLNDINVDSYNLETSYGEFIIYSTEKDYDFKIQDQAVVEVNHSDGKRENIYLNSDRNIIELENYTISINFLLYSVAIIYKLYDEWYLVEYEGKFKSKYYKCDQIDGLLYLLGTLNEEMNN